MDRMEIIDFHTHPFLYPADNICRYQDHCAMSAERILPDLHAAGISKFCGSVIRTKESVAKACGTRPDDLSWWDVVHACNEEMLALRDVLGPAYLPGVMVHPDYVGESLAEMETLYAQGVRLVGELVPYSHGWEDYSCPGFSKLLDAAQDLGMAVSIHSMGDDAMDAMAAAHPGCAIVFAHPGEAEAVRRHMARLNKSESFYLDLSGTGLFRHGVLRALIDEVGVEKILFGTDYPVCNPYMYVGGVGLDPMLSDGEKGAVFAENTRRLFAGLGLEV